MSTPIFTLLLGIGVWRLVIRKGQNYFFWVGGLTLLLLMSVIVVDWSQAGWERDYLLDGWNGFQYYFLQPVIFVGLGVVARYRENRRRT